MDEKEESKTDLEAFLILEEFDSDAEYLEDSEWPVDKRRHHIEIVDAFEPSPKRLKEDL